MTGNKCYLTEYEDYDGGFVSFGDGKGRISGKGTRDNIVTGQAEKKTEPGQDEEDAEEKPTEMDESGASDKVGDNDQATRIHLSPVSNVTLMDSTRIFGNAYDDEDVGVEADLNNLETT
ncbi:hypothetical protein Tco_0259478, partial [Tanacetum coccineum]